MHYTLCSQILRNMLVFKRLVFLAVGLRPIFCLKDLELFKECPLWGWGFLRYPSAYKSEFWEKL